LRVVLAKFTSKLGIIRILVKGIIGKMKCQIKILLSEKWGEGDNPGNVSISHFIE